jgi:hypothetical protein
MHKYVSAYLVDIANMADTNIQKILPTPPTIIAEDTPIILPVPIVAASTVISELKEDIPFVLEGLNIQIKPFNIFFCGKLSLKVKYTCVNISKIINGVSHEASVNLSNIFSNVNHLKEKNTI